MLISTAAMLTHGLDRGKRVPGDSERVEEPEEAESRSYSEHRPHDP